MVMTAPQPAAIYCRHSTIDQRGSEDRSTVNQEHTCQERAEALALHVEEVFTEQAGISASHLSNDVRPQYEEALKWLSSGKDRTLVCYSLDRATRKGMTEAGYLLDLCDEHNGRVISVRDNLDTTDPGARLRVALAAELAREEIQRLGDRIRWGMAGARRRRKPAGVKPVFGWRKKDEDVPDGVSPYELDTTEADAVRRTVAHIIDGASIGEAVRILNGEGFRNRAGGPFTVGFFSGFVRRPQMLGHLALADGEGEKVVALDDDGVTPFQWTAPILDEATYLRVDRILRSRCHPGSLLPRSQSKHVYLLSGLLVCGVCGTLITRHSRHESTQSYYRCQGGCSPATALPEPEADAFVTNAALRRLAALDRNDSPILAYIVDHWIERSGASTPVGEIEDELEVMANRLRRLQKDFYGQVGKADGYIDDDTFETLQTQLMGHLNDLQQRLDTARLSAVDAGDVFADFLPSAGSTEGNPAESEEWLAVPLHKRRELMRMVVDRIDVEQQQPYKVREGGLERMTIHWVTADTVADYHERFSNTGRRRFSKM